METSFDSQIPVVYTGGTFDLFHYGHLNFLRMCSQYGKVVVSINTDEFVQDFKDVTPTDSYLQRSANVLRCRYVSSVIRNWGGADSKPAIDAVAPNIIAIGSDWLSKDYLSQMSLTEEYLVQRQIAVLYLPYTPGISSSILRNQAQQSDVLRLATA